MKIGTKGRSAACKSLLSPHKRRILLFVSPWLFFLVHDQSFPLRPLDDVYDGLGVAPASRIGSIRRDDESFGTPFALNAVSSPLLPDESDRILGLEFHPIASSSTSANAAGRDPDIIADTASTKTSIVHTIFSSSHLLNESSSATTTYNYPIAVKGSKDSSIGLHVVVSHCDKPLAWIWDQLLANERWKSMTIYSKCGNPPNKADLPPKANVVILPNVGRCDHSYAYWIADTLKEMQRGGQDSRRDQFSPHDHVVFVKDNDNAYREKLEEKVSWDEMKYLTVTKGFACAARVTYRDPKEGINLVLNVASKYSLGHFRFYWYKRKRIRYEIKSSPSESRRPLAKFSSQFKSMEGWYRSLRINMTIGSSAPLAHLPKDLRGEPRRKATSLESTLFMPMCFGGHFMASIERIQKAPVDDWNAIVQSLGRGDNIEEGHFMERTWAGLLAPPITRLEEEAILEHNYRIIHKPVHHPFLGLVVID